VPRNRAEDRKTGSWEAGSKQTIGLKPRRKIMAKKKTRQSDYLTEWEQLIATLTAAAAELPHLESSRIKLQGFLEAARSLVQEQSLHDANKQAASQELETTFVNGKKLATFLRGGIREHFGNRSPRLVEFGIQPFRRGNGNVIEPPTPPQPEEPEEPETPPVE
jgi:hypothetical protein